MSITAALTVVAVSFVNDGLLFAGKKHKPTKRIPHDHHAPGMSRDRLKAGVTFYFHDVPKKGHVTKVVSVEFPNLMKDGKYHVMDGFTGSNVTTITLTRGTTSSTCPTTARERYVAYGGKVQK